MSKIKGIIFDMDGSLYPFDHGAAATFGQSKFSQQIIQNCVRFFQEKFGLDEMTATARLQDIMDRFDGEVSLGLEKEHGIPRAEYFGATWDLDPAEFMQPNAPLAAALSELTIQRAVLSAAPTVWLHKALGHLQLTEVFATVFSGEPDIRKPSPEAFRQVANFWQLPPHQILAVGDQEITDILPARSIGMKTLRIGNDPYTKADFMAPDALAALTLLKKERIL